MGSEPRWIEADLPQPLGVDPKATARMLRVAPELAGMRLDVFLAFSLRHTSRTRAKRIAKTAAYSVDGLPLKPNHRLKPEEHIVLWRVPMDDLDLSLQLPILYEDEHLLVVNKPAGITVHPTASHYHRTVVRILEAQRPGQYVRLVHRLDKDTSGVLLLALSPESDRAFKMLLEGTLPIPSGVDASLTKTYQAITWGCPREGIIDVPLERDLDNPMRVKMRVSAEGSGLDAQTRVTVKAESAHHALVECALLTGRQHQIRVHLAHMGSAVVGDRLYGPDETLHAKGADGHLTREDLERLQMPRQALHAWRYELPHALTWKRLDLKAPLPEDMADFWDEAVRGLHGPGGH